MAATPTIDEQKLEQFMGQFVQDMGAAATAPLVVLGDKLGLYKAMADGEPVTPAELAERTDCREAGPHHGGDGGRAGDARGAGRAHRLPRALPARVAVPEGGQRLRGLRP